MPIGSDLNLTLPTVGSNPSAAAAAIIDTFQRLEAAVEGDVPSGALDVTTDINMQTHGLTNTAFAGLANQATSTAALPGYAFRYGNDLWWAHPSGNFKITAGVGLNAAGIKGIGGDYGLGAEAVTYSAAADEYVFVDAPGDYSDLSVNGVRLEDPAGGSVRLVAHQATVSGDQDWSLTALAATTSGIITQTSAGVTGVTSSVADPFTFNGALTVGGALTRLNREMTIMPTTGSIDVLGWTSDQGPGSNGLIAPSTTRVFVQGFPLHKGDTVLSLTIATILGGAGSTMRVRAYYRTNVGTSVSLFGPTNFTVTAAAANHVVNMTDRTLGTQEAFFVEVNHESGTAFWRVTGLTLTYNQA